MRADQREEVVLPFVGAIRTRSHYQLKPKPTGASKSRADGSSVWPTFLRLLG